jgi:2-amino-4-hydroxy-6-hydroxymethyldihydropteridine diphosphokinase
MTANRNASALAFISLGSNIEPELNLPRALRRLSELGDVIRISNVYENPAKGPIEQEDFLNAAVLLMTTLTPTELRSELRRIEAELGRDRAKSFPGLSAEEAKYAPRSIDLDLSLHGVSVLKTAQLRIPDPEIRTQSHIAIPLAELAPDFPHPETGEPLRDIAAALSDQHEMGPRPDVWAERDLSPTSDAGPHEPPRKRGP